MSLGHVYIVLEPVGSARLTFDDDQYYEFMCFDVPKVVWSPRCHHGHDKESRNGRDMKIDILEVYIWMSEVFRVKSGFYRSTRGLLEPPGGFIGPTWALREKREGGRRWPRTPPLPSPNRTREGGGAPLSETILVLILLSNGTRNPSATATPLGTS